MSRYQQRNTSFIIVIIGIYSHQLFEADRKSHAGEDVAFQGPHTGNITSSTDLVNSEYFTFLAHSPIK